MDILGMQLGSAPLDHAAQRSRSLLAQRGSLGKRRKPSRGSLRAFLAAVQWDPDTVFSGDENDLILQNTKNFVNGHSEDSGIADAETGDRSDMKKPRSISSDSSPPVVRHTPQGTTIEIKRSPRCDPVTPLDSSSPATANESRHRRDHSLDSGCSFDMSSEGTIDSPESSTPTKRSPIPDERAPRVIIDEKQSIVTTNGCTSASSSSPSSPASRSNGETTPPPPPQFADTPPTSRRCNGVPGNQALTTSPDVQVNFRIIPHERSSSPVNVNETSSSSRRSSLSRSESCRSAVEVQSWDRRRVTSLQARDMRYKTEPSRRCRSLSREPEPEWLKIARDKQKSSVDWDKLEHKKMEPQSLPSVKLLSNQTSPRSPSPAQPTRPSSIMEIPPPLVSNGVVTATPARVVVSPKPPPASAPSTDLKSPSQQRPMDLSKPSFLNVQLRHVEKSPPVNVVFSTKSPTPDSKPSSPFLSARENLNKVEKPSKAQRTTTPPAPPSPPATNGYSAFLLETRPVELIEKTSPKEAERKLLSSGRRHAGGMSTALLSGDSDKFFSNYYMTPSSLRRSASVQLRPKGDVSCQDPIERSPLWKRLEARKSCEVTPDWVREAEKIRNSGVDWESLGKSTNIRRPSKMSSVSTDALNASPEGDGEPEWLREFRRRKDDDAKKKKLWAVNGIEKTANDENQNESKKIFTNGNESKAESPRGGSPSVESSWKDNTSKTAPSRDDAKNKMEGDLPLTNGRHSPSEKDLEQVQDSTISTFLESFRKRSSQDGNHISQIQEDPASEDDDDSSDNIPPPRIIDFQPKGPTSPALPVDNLSTVESRSKYLDDIFREAEKSELASLAPASLKDAKNTGKEGDTPPPLVVKETVTKANERDAQNEAPSCMNAVQPLVVETVESPAEDKRSKVHEESKRSEKAEIEKKRSEKEDNLLGAGGDKEEGQVEEEEVEEEKETEVKEEAPKGHRMAFLTELKYVLRKRGIIESSDSDSSPVHSPIRETPIIQHLLQESATPAPPSMEVRKQETNQLPTAEHPKHLGIESTFPATPPAPPPPPPPNFFKDVHSPNEPLSPPSGSDIVKAKNSLHKTSYFSEDDHLTDKTSGDTTLSPTLRPPPPLPPSLFQCDSNQAPTNQQQQSPDKDEETGARNSRKRVDKMDSDQFRADPSSAASVNQPVTTLVHYPTTTVTPVLTIGSPLISTRLNQLLILSPNEAITTAFAQTTPSHVLTSPVSVLSSPDSVFSSPTTITSNPMLNSTPVNFIQNNGIPNTVIMSNGSVPPPPHVISASHAVPPVSFIPENLIAQKPSVTCKATSTSEDEKVVSSPSEYQEPGKRKVSSDSRNNVGQSNQMTIKSKTISKSKSDEDSDTAPELPPKQNIGQKASKSSSDKPLPAPRATVTKNGTSQTDSCPRTRRDQDFQSIKKVLRQNGTKEDSESSPNSRCSPSLFEDQDDMYATIAPRTARMLPLEGCGDTSDFKSSFIEPEIDYYDSSLDPQPIYKTSAELHLKQSKESSTSRYNNNNHKGVPLSTSSQSSSPVPQDNKHPQSFRRFPSRDSLSNDYYEEDLSKDKSRQSRKGNKTRDVGITILAGSTLPKRRPAPPAEETDSSDDNNIGKSKSKSTCVTTGVDGTISRCQGGMVQNGKSSSVAVQKNSSNRSSAIIPRARLQQAVPPFSRTKSASVPNLLDLELHIKRMTSTSTQTPNGNVSVECLYDSYDEEDVQETGKNPPGKTRAVQTDETLRESKKRSSNRDWTILAPNGLFITKVDSSTPQRSVRKKVTKIVRGANGKGTEEIIEEIYDQSVVKVRPTGSVKGVSRSVRQTSDGHKYLTTVITESPVGTGRVRRKRKDLDEIENRVIMV